MVHAVTPQSQQSASWKGLCQTIEKNNWPANSCVLNPLDYGIWGIMVKSAYGKRKRYDNIDDLKAGIRKAWEELTQDTINKVIDQWRHRLQQVVDIHGGHIEQYM